MSLPIPFKILNSICFILFGLFAAAQYNDIDPAVYYHPSTLDAALWLLFYGLISVLSLAILFKPFPRWLLITAGLACFIQLGRAAPGLWANLFGDQPFTMMQVSMSGEDPRVEQTREFFGALIALAGVTLLWWERRRFVKPSALALEPLPN